MRRIAAFAAAFGILLMAGCGKTGSVVPAQPLAGHTGNYEAAVTIAYKGLEAAATLTQELPGSCTVNFTAPDSLQDMAFVFDEDSVDVSYKGLLFPFHPQSLPGGALAKIMTASINKAMMDDGITAASTEADIRLTGMLEVGEFTLTLDRESGALLKLSLPAEDLEIEFQNFRFLD